MGPGVVHPLVASGGVSGYALTLGALEVAALVLGLLWAALNLYQFAPVLVAGVARPADRMSGRESQPLERPHGTLPTVEVLLPAYQEGAVVEGAIRSILAADYPAEKLGLSVIVEAGDAETRGPLDELHAHADLDFDVVPVPAWYPGPPTKPRALNYAFESVDAEVIGVVDAEDVIDASLVHEAVTRLTTDCEFVQARLDMGNEDDGWLNVLARAEYGFWYEVVLAAFDRVGYPLPLSGTSCFFRRSVLVAADVDRADRFEGTPSRDDRLWTGTRRLFGWTPWDPRSLTEDFDLGLFLWARGFDVGYLDAITVEQSPRSINDWIKQRTRWKQGKFQTLRKYLDTPPEGWAVRGHVFWLSALPLLGPANVAGVVVLVGLANLARYEPEPVVQVLLGLGVSFAIVATALFAYGYWSASDAPTAVRVRRVLLVVLTLPGYWLLQWTADLRAIWRTTAGRADWERVRHHRADEAEQPVPVVGPTRSLDPVRRRIALLLTLIAAASIRFYDLSGLSLWIDELYTVVRRSALPLPDLLLVAGDPHPPLYFLVLRGWMDVFGSTPGGVRGLSAAVSVATVFGIYLLGTELFDDRVGLLAAMLIGVSSFHVHHGRTARMYSLFGLLVIGSWLAFARLHSADRVTLVGYIGATAAMLYTHVFAVFVLAAQYLVVGLAGTGTGVSRRQWLRAQAGVVVLVTPVLGVLARTALGPLVGVGAGPGFDLTWLPAPSTIALTTTVLGYVGYPAHYPIAGESTWTWIAAGGIALVTVGVTTFAFVTYRPGDGFRMPASGSVGQMAALAVVPLAAPFVLSLAGQSVFAPRYTLPASIGLAILAAAGVVNAPGRRLRFVLLVVLLVGSGTLLGAYFAADTVEDWRAATTAIERDAQPDDLLVLQPGWIEPAIEYYVDRPEIPRLHVPDGTPPPGVLDRLDRRAAAADRVWVVTYRAPPVTDGRSAFEDRERRSVYDAGAITVVRYDRRT